MRRTPGRYNAAGHGEGCPLCPRGTYSATDEDAMKHNCTSCYLSTSSIPGQTNCTPCESGRSALVGYPKCLDCAETASNASCPVGPNGLKCSGLGSCVQGACLCRLCASGGDCARSSCQGEAGVVGFALASKIVSVVEGTTLVQLKLKRLLGTTGARTVGVSVDDDVSTAVAGSLPRAGHRPQPGSSVGVALTTRRSVEH